MKFFRTIVATAVIAAIASVAAAQRAKNVIYLIADGAGYNTYVATGYFNGDFGSECVRGPGWKGFGMSTYPLRTSTSPGGLEQDPHAVYDPAKNWDTTLVGEGALEFQGYAWTSDTAPDSAATLSSSMTGVKSFNNAVNVDGAGNPLVTFARLAYQARGMRTGIVTTVQWPDATPAAFSGICNISRTHRNQIADQMLAAPYIEVIMGAGNPDYDDDGNRRPTPDHYWISGATWDDLKDGDAGGFSKNWQLIQDQAEFEKLADGSLVPAPGKKILGVVKSFDGKQQHRSADGGRTTNYTTLPNQHLRSDVPELKTMVRGALRLVENPDGFFLGIEQGEVDRAMHANHLGRMIEAMLEFNAAVAWLDDYLTANAGNPDKPNYDNTLVIVTADHDHLLLGPDADTVPYQELVDNGAGKLPGAKFQTKEHSNQLVPIFAKGPGSELLAHYADQTDRYSDAQSRTFGHGKYLDQSELFTIFLCVTICPSPAPRACCEVAP